MDKNKELKIRTRELFEKYRESKNERKEIEELILKENISLVDYTIRKMKNSGIYFPLEDEDIYSVALAGLLASIRGYNPTKKVAFPSYAVTTIRNKLLHVIQKYDLPKRRGKNLYLESVVFVNGSRGGEMTRLETVESSVPTPADELRNNENFDLLEKALDSLSEKEREVIAKMFGVLGQERQKQADVAEGLGVAFTTVRAMRNRALLKMREHLEEGDFESWIAHSFRK